MAPKDHETVPAGNQTWRAGKYTIFYWKIIGKWWFNGILWWFYPIIGDFPIATPISCGFPVATFDYQRVYLFKGLLGPGPIQRDAIQLCKGQSYEQAPQCSEVAHNGTYLSYFDLLYNA